MNHSIESIINDTEEEIKLLRLKIMNQEDKVQWANDNVSDLRKKLIKEIENWEKEKAKLIEMQKMERKKRREIRKLNRRLFWYNLKEKAGSLLHIPA